MKYAFFPGCVSKGACPELYQSVMQVYPRLGIELAEMTTASCTGAGVLQEKDLRLGDALNARTFALAEQQGLPIMTICSTCQGVMSQANHRLTTQPHYLQEINGLLQEEGLTYRGTTTIKHFLWILLEDVGEETLRRHITRRLSGLRAAPFYGCYIQRPTNALEFDRHPDRGKSLERIIEILGAEVVDFPGKTRCCGFPILTINEKNSLTMVATHTRDAKSHGADIMVTPCPLCHLNLDGMQTKAASQEQASIDLPILHLPQLLGLAMGLDTKSLGLQRNLISPESALARIGGGG
ncbi:CoB--CoM heterodisulfide reductase iron-sulfur subunit B family protein [Candidatus Nitrospira neomarina]|uniref:CoB--CoM heterodisulfide reductase iron-sulfur subunit B family protein n=1 Tax=Candidatus Nitrospira neomarina TaxID=3020899 RepID=A0AA96GTN4_9BACT|nr:CoB--CoM heterodisulfide reductase iron-sulfur subunit B family protein [Candidatus Nitrospira neomarina]WNM63874.1 CoB--CoM heterodisulfide reductase iron-sulfur subunit B family protein [Candidatus Nitrospira neomarina]